MIVRIDPKDFKRGIKNVKLMKGARYNADNQTWTIDDCEAKGIADNGYGLIVVRGAKAVNPATTYMGEASMDHPDSIF